MIRPAGAATRPVPTQRIEQASRRLAEAARARVPCAPVRDLIGPDDEISAYAVQRLGVDARVRAGARVVGRKVGLTSPAVQAQLGVDRPDFGVLFDDMDRSAGPGLRAAVALEELLQPRIEAEVAFVLGADLSTGVLDDDQVRAAVAVARPALEIVDSRIAGWDISFADTVADNGSCGVFVLGSAALPLEGFEPATARMEMRCDGRVASTGSGDACLGDPVRALAWLARTSRAAGDPLLAGDVVLSGALGPMVDVTGPAAFTAGISGLGPVSVSFTRKETR